jgi:hypothetical protein
MQNSVPRTALPGRSQSSLDVMSKGLGYFSLALGLAELAAPGGVCRAAGLDGHRSLVRAYGAREIANGVAILASHDATPWVWGRVAGDVADIATVVACMRGDNPRKGNAGVTLAALLGITALDVFCAGGLTAEKGGPETARADYHDRSGFPQGPTAARGAARNRAISHDGDAPNRLLGQRQQEASEKASDKVTAAEAPASSD